MKWFSKSLSSSVDSPSKTNMDERNYVTWLQALIYLQFFVAVTIFIFSLIGVAIHQHVEPMFLLALLQFLIAVPGCVYNTQRSWVFLVMYNMLQATTGICELIWFIAGLCNGDVSTPLLLTLLLLSVIQIGSVVIAGFFRDKQIHFGRRKIATDGHLQPIYGFTPNPPTTASQKESAPPMATAAPSSSAENSEEIRPNRSDTKIKSSKRTPGAGSYSKDSERGIDKSVRRTKKRKRSSSVQSNVSLQDTMKQNKEKMERIQRKLREEEDKPSSRSMTMTEVQHQRHNSNYIPSPYLQDTRTPPMDPPVQQTNATTTSYRSLHENKTSNISDVEKAEPIITQTLTYDHIHV